MALRDYDIERRVLERTTTPRFCWHREQALLDPAPYLQPAWVWASVTLIVLGRHSSGMKRAGFRGLIVDSCANVGLPRPDPGRIQVGKRSAIEGAPPAWPRQGAEHDVLAFMGFPKEHRSQIASTNPIERVNNEIKRRSRVVGIFPNNAAIVRLVGALLIAQTDEWHITRRYWRRPWYQTPS